MYLDFLPSKTIPDWSPHINDSAKSTEVKIYRSPDVQKIDFSSVYHQRYLTSTNMYT